jgi:hypothetical protein
MNPTTYGGHKIRHFLGDFRAKDLIRSALGALEAAGAIVDK